MLETQPIKKKKKLVNNRRKSRELVMKSIYRGILNQFDINQIKKIANYKLDLNYTYDYLYTNISQSFSKILFIFNSLHSFNVIKKSFNSL